MRCSAIPTRPAQRPGRRALLLQRRALVVLVAVAVGALLAGCGSPVRGAHHGNAAASGSKAPPGFPVTVTDCGVRTTYRHPPQRAVTMNQHATEVMLALGLANHMVGTAYRDDTILPKYRDAYQRIPVLAKHYPSYEALLKAAPDFVYGGFASAFNAQDGRSRQRLRAAGIKTYLNIATCTDSAVTMTQVRQEIHTIAKIFGVPNRAKALISTMNTTLAKTTRKVRGVEPVSVFVYDSGTKAPVTAGGHGIANDIVHLAGGRNVFASLNKGWTDVSWEQVIQRRPDWIVIMDYGSTSVQQKKQTLLNNSALANVPAIKHHRFSVLPLTSAVAGIRVPHAVSQLARQLHPGGFR
jgi:iron complex transport system substrate-binding protein